MKLDTEALAREAGGTVMQPYDYGAKPDRMIMKFSDLEALAHLIVERCAVECDKRGAQFHAESPFTAECHGLAAAIRQLLEDKP